MFEIIFLLAIVLIFSLYANRSYSTWSEKSSRRFILEASEKLGSYLKIEMKSKLFTQFFISIDHEQLKSGVVVNIIHSGKNPDAKSPTVVDPCEMTFTGIS